MSVARPSSPENCPRRSGGFRRLARTERWVGASSVDDVGVRVRVIGVGRAGGSFERALATAGWDVLPGIGRDEPVAEAACDADLVLITTPDAAVADVADRIHPVDLERHVAERLSKRPLSAVSFQLSATAEG